MKERYRAATVREWVLPMAASLCLLVVFFISGCGSKVQADGKRTHTNTNQPQQ